MSAPRARTLRDTQVWMVSAITGAEADAPAHDLERFVTPGPRMSASERFEVYRSGYHARLVECLLDDYPVLAAMLGDDQFGRLCRAYVDRHPSASPNLNAFGRHMASLCREVHLEGEGAEAFDAMRVFAAELAALEWALVEVLHAECPPPLDAAALQAIPPDAWARARFVKSDALRLFRFEYPVNAVFIANRIEEIIPDVPAPAPNAVAVYRKDMQLWRMDLTPAMMGIVEPLFLGKSLGEALAALEAEVTDPEVLAQTGASLMVWFREWVDAGFFTRIELDPAEDDEG
ncbi:MAG TPA: DNA-binding domain-containing protein [Labilithrix sp.]|nr:DNA-binding domain-containing protein [Labilithrix sp.]